MTQALTATGQLSLVQPIVQSIDNPKGLATFMDVLGITDVSSGTWIEKLPFAPADVSAGTENELQVAVAQRMQGFAFAHG